MIQQTLEELQLLIHKEATRINYHGLPNSLYDPIYYMLGLGGKRMRPILVLLAAKAYGSDPAKAISPALGVEMFHNFSLVHDDIMDQAPLRRGQATVHTKWDTNTAILSGDLMMVKAMELICQVPDIYLRQVLEVFHKTAAEVCEGQQWDMEFEKAPQVRIDDYVNMIRLKTAVLLGGALKIGAILGGAEASDADQLYKYGVNLGLAFQLKDDILDVYGDAAKTGKQKAGDIISNKKTWLYLKSLQMGHPAHREQLLQWFHTQPADPSEKVESVLRIWEELNIKALAEQEVNRYFDEAEKNLQRLDISQEGRDLLNGMADFLRTRIS